MTQALYALFQKYPLICTDSRRVTEGCLFFALKGETFDGNAFALESLTKGAAYAVVDDPSLPENDRLIKVPDVLIALQTLAQHHRRQFDFPVLVIAGSNGKTTTKELVAAVMSGHYKAHFTKGNLNNHIGVPLTLLQLTDAHEIAIIEIGANHPQEHTDLCTITEPTHAVVTNMGKDHLEGFGSFVGVQRANAEVYDWMLAHKGTLFINRDEPYLQDWLPTNREGLHLIFYHRSANPSMAHTDYEAVLLEANPFLKVGFLNSKGVMIEAQTQLVGEHNFANIMTAIAIGKYFKVPTQVIKTALENYVPSMNRSQIVQHQSGALILLDAYNANPSSMSYALKTLSQMHHVRKIAIIGDMFEMGEASHAEHAAIYQEALQYHFTQLVTVGKAFGAVVTESVPIQSVRIHFYTTAEAQSWFKEQTFDDQTALMIKGSRGMRLETLLI